MQKKSDRTNFKETNGKNRCKK